MSTRRNRTFAACAAIGTACLLGLGGASLAPAQEQNSRASNEPEAAFGVSFKGGSLEAFVDAVRKSSGDVPVNIIVSGDTDGLMVPPIILERATVGNAVRSLQYLNVEPFRIGVSSTGPNDTAVHSVAVQRQSFERNVGGRQVMTTNEPTTLEVISLTELLEGTSDSDATADTATLLTAIDTALAMAGDADAAQLKFHPDSSLLIVRGTDRQADLVRRLISEVHQDVKRRREYTTQLQHELRAAEINLQKQQIRVRSASAELDLAHSEFDQLRKLHENNMVSESEIRGAELTMQKMKSEVELAEMELHQQIERSSFLQDKLKSSKQQFATPTTAEAIRAEINRLQERISELQSRLRALDSGSRAR